MIDPTVVVVTAILLIIASLGIEYIFRAADTLDEDIGVKEALIAIILIVTVSYFLMSVLNITLSIFLGILLAKFLMGYVK